MGNLAWAAGLPADQRRHQQPNSSRQHGGSRSMAVALDLLRSRLRCTQCLSRSCSVRIAPRQTRSAQASLTYVQSLWRHSNAFSRLCDRGFNSSHMTIGTFNDRSGAPFCAAAAIYWEQLRDQPQPAGASTAGRPERQAAALPDAVVCQSLAQPHLPDPTSAALYRRRPPQQVQHHGVLWSMADAKGPEQRQIIHLTHSNTMTSSSCTGLVHTVFS